MNSRNHYFRDEHDNRTVIITVLLPSGAYRAELEDQNDIRSLGPRGYGHTRLAAIADLNEILKEMAQ